jgi:hypothetical protein
VQRDRRQARRPELTVGEGHRLQRDRVQRRPGHNLDKFVFGVSKGKMLGYIIRSKGIRANPDKTKAIMSMVDPLSKKRSAEIDRQSSSPQQVHFKVR